MYGRPPVVALIRAGTGACPYKFLRLNHYRKFSSGRLKDANC